MRHSITVRNKGFKRITAASVAALVLAGCSSEDSAVEAPEVDVLEAVPSENGGTETSAPLEVSIVDPWARSLPNGMGSIYGLFTLSADDVLVAVELNPASVASVAEIHEVTADAEGVMRMRELEGGLPMRAGEQVELKPGGYHIMLMGMAEVLEPGSMLEVTLVFESGARSSFPVAVAGADAGSDGMDHSMGDGAEHDMGDLNTGDDSEMGAES